MKRARFTAVGSLAITADSLGVEFECPGAPSKAFEECGRFAVVSINGPLMQRAEPPSIFQPAWDSYDAIGARIEAALASNKPEILLKISSPGGQVAGCFELAEAIRQKAAAARKPVTAYVDGIAASAAYAIACAATRICVPPTGLVGSIGCMQLSVDLTNADRAMGVGFEVFTSGARKADGNPHIAMSDDARAAIQGGVNDMAETFFQLVATARPLSVANVAGLQAAIFVGSKAVDARLADEVRTFAEVIADANARVTASGDAGSEETPMTDEEKAKAALQAIAEGDDEKAAARAKKALAAFGDDDDSGEKEEKKDEEAKADADSDSDSEEKKDEDTKAEKGDDEAKASAASNPTMALAAKVQSLEAWKTQREENEERSKLMASRPDFAPEVVALMKRSPLSTVRDAVKSLPRGAPAKKGQLHAALAALETPATAQGASTPDAHGYDHETAVALGLAAPRSAVRHEGNKLILGVMRPAEARAELARREHAAAKKGGV